MKSIATLLAALAVAGSIAACSKKEEAPVAPAAETAAPAAAPAAPAEPAKQ